jgi:hypothetical protein
LPTKNHDKKHQEEIMTPKQRETNILQAINSCNADDNNDDSPGNNLSNIGQPTIPSRATSNITSKNYGNVPRLLPELKQQLDKTEQNQEANLNTSKRAKNIEEWKAIFNKARETIPKTEEQPKITKIHRGIQPTIMPIEGNEAFGNTMETID